MNTIDEDDIIRAFIVNYANAYGLPGGAKATYEKIKEGSEPRPDFLIADATLVVECKRIMDPQFVDLINPAKAVSALSKEVSELPLFQDGKLLAHLDMRIAPKSIANRKSRAEIVKEIGLAISQRKDPILVRNGHFKAAYEDIER